LIRNLGKTAFNDYLNNSAPLSDYFFNSLVKDIDMTNADGRAKLANLAKPLLAKIPKTVFRDLMYKELNEKVGINISVSSSVPASTENHTVQDHNNQSSRTLRYTKTRLAIALLIRDPKLAEFALSLEELSHLQSIPGIDLFIKLLEIIEDKPDITAIALVERFHSDENYSSLQKLLLWDPPDMENRELSFKQTMSRFRDDIRKIELDSLIQHENL